MQHARPAPRATPRTDRRSHRPFQTASGEILDHYGSKMVPYDLGSFGHLGINYEVTDVNGPFAAVSSMNDSGLTVVFTPNGSWVSSEAPPRPTERVDMVRESRTFWLDVPRTTEGQLSHLIPLKLEQAAAPAPAGRPADEAAAAELQHRAGGFAGGDQPKDEDMPAPRRRPQPKGPTEDERTNHELTHVVFRSWCRHCVSTRAKEDPHRRTESHEGGVPKIMMDWLFFTSDSEPNVMLPVLLAYDLTSGAVSALQVGKDCSATTVAAVAQVLDTWGHADVVLHMNGEPSSKALVKAVAAARGHRTLPRHGPPHSHQSQGGAGRGHHRGVPGHLHREQVGLGECDRQDPTTCERLVELVGEACWLARHALQHGH